MNAGTYVFCVTSCLSLIISLVVGVYSLRIGLKVRKFLDYSTLIYISIALLGAILVIIQQAINLLWHGHFIILKSIGLFTQSFFMLCQVSLQNFSLDGLRYFAMPLKRLMNPIKTHKYVLKIGLIIGFIFILMGSTLDIVYLCTPPELTDRTIFRSLEIVQDFFVIYLNILQVINVNYFWRHYSNRMSKQLAVYQVLLVITFASSSTFLALVYDILSLAMLFGFVSEWDKIYTMVKTVRDVVFQTGVVLESVLTGLNVSKMLDILVELSTVQAEDEWRGK